MKRLLIVLLLATSSALAQTVSTIQPVQTTDTPNQGRMKWNKNDSLLAKGVDSLRADVAYRSRVNTFTGDTNYFMNWTFAKSGDRVRLRDSRASSTEGSGFALDTVTAWYNTNLKATAIAFDANGGIIKADNGLSFWTRPERNYSAMYFTDRWATTTTRPYLESTTPHALLHVNRYGPSTYSSTDDIGGASFRMITNSNLTVQPTAVKGSWSVVDVGSSSPAYTAGGLYVPQMAFGAKGSVYQYGATKLSLGASFVANNGHLGGAGGFRRSVGLLIEKPGGSSSVTDSTIGIYYQNPGNAITGGMRAFAVLEDSGKILWQDVGLFRATAGELRNTGKLTNRGTVISEEGHSQVIQLPSFEAGYDGLRTGVIRYKSEGGSGSHVDIEGPPQITGGNKLIYVPDKNGTIVVGSDGNTAPQADSTVLPPYRLRAADNSPTTAVYADNDGNVGVNTTTPSSYYNTTSGARIGGIDNSDKWLSVLGASGSSPVLNLVSNEDVDGGTIGGMLFSRALGQTDAHRNVAGIVATQYSTGAVTAAHLDFWVKDVSYPFMAMRIQRDGKIGVGTTAPQNKLDVEGGAAIGASYSGANSAPANGLLVEGSVGIGTTSPQNKLDIEGGAAIGASYSGTNAAPTNGLIVEGNVGIGTVSPQENLHVKGVLRIQESSPSATLLRFANTSGVSKWLFYLSGNNLRFWDTDDRLTLQGGGNVGIGTTSPSEKLEVNGKIKASGIKGITDGSDAGSGDVGEFISATVNIGQAVSLTNGTAANVTSITLSAGDWDVSGVVKFKLTGATTSSIAGYISTTSATASDNGFILPLVLSDSGADVWNMPPTTRVNVTSNTTVYLVAKADFSVGSVDAYGRIQARRIR